jgi:hypothetical protein
MRIRILSIGWLALGVILFGIHVVGVSGRESTLLNGSTTVILYMNGDNDLTDEVLSAVDRMETVGSSTKLNIVALVDGHPSGISRFGHKWVDTHLLHITHDKKPNRINSKVLANWGEQDLGQPETLARFIREAIHLFPAETYMFCAFAHGKGVIDTGNLTGNPREKTLCISSDATSQTIMSLTAFEGALKTGLNGQRFSLMVLFSCLSSMVEIAYALSDVTDYLIASEDEIRIVNQPPGTHQLRGISFKDLLYQLKRNPSLSETELGHLVINRFIEPYHHEVSTFGTGGQKGFSRYPASLALIDCRSLGGLAIALSDIAGQIMMELNRPDTVLHTLNNLQRTLDRSQTFKSFLNLEYYDLLNWLNEMAYLSTSEDIRSKCVKSINILKEDVIKYERHTSDVSSNGISIYFNHHLVPENIYTAHQAMYRQTRFSQDTRWDDLIDKYRKKMQDYQADLLLYQCRLAYQTGNRENYIRLLSKTYRALFDSIREGQDQDAQKYTTFLNKLPQTERLAELEVERERLISRPKKNQ